MSAAIDLISGLMSIITPEEINELTTSSKGNVRLSLTDLMNMRIDGEDLDFSPEAEESGAKILPFKKIEEEQEEETIEHFHVGENVQEYMEHYFKCHELGNSAVDEEGNRKDTSVFILNEKEKFEYSRKKLKSREVLGLYMKNATVDIEQEKMIRDDLSKSTRTGVLIDKKQF
jgi:hypothetical protein